MSFPQWGTQKISCHIINSVLSYLSYALLLLPAVRVGEMNNILTSDHFSVLNERPKSLFSISAWPGSSKFYQGFALFSAMMIIFHLTKHCPNGNFDAQEEILGYY